jgi:hypothetical protein
MMGWFTRAGVGGIGGAWWAPWGLTEQNIVMAGSGSRLY